MNARRAAVHTRNCKFKEAAVRRTHGTLGAGEARPMFPKEI